MSRIHFVLKKYSWNVFFFLKKYGHLISSEASFQVSLLAFSVSSILSLFLVLKKCVWIGGSLKTKTLWNTAHSKMFLLKSSWCFLTKFSSLLFSNHLCQPTSLYLCGSVNQNKLVLASQKACASLGQFNKPESYSL